VEPARELFDRFREQGEALIDRMVDEGEQENLYLDFKQASKGSAPMQEDDRKTLAEAISGFANSDGGVIVWGVDARKGPTANDPDAAQDRKPITNLSRWISDLNSYTAQYVQPAVTGVEHLPIFTSSTSDSGYAVTYVPKSLSSLHMATAKMKEQYCYFVRSGSSFVKMEHFMVADRLGRRPQPKLELSCHFIPGATFVHANDGRAARFTFVIGIRNAGLGIANYPGVALSPLPPLFLASGGLTGSGGPEGNGLKRRQQSPLTDRSAKPPPTFFTGGADDTIHPSTTLDVTAVNYMMYPQQLLDPEVKIEYALYCDGFSGRGVLTIPTFGLTHERTYYGAPDAVF